MRVVLALTAICMALGMIQKGNCYEGTWQNGDCALHPHVLLRPALPLHRSRVRRAELALQRRRAGAGRATRSWSTPSASPTGPGARPWVTPLAHRVARRRSSRSAPADRSGSPARHRGARARCVTFVIDQRARDSRCSPCCPAWLLAGVDPGRPWDAAAFATARRRCCSRGWSTGTCVAVAFVAGALWAWARGRPLLTGVLIGLGAATKLYPLFLLGGRAGDLRAPAARSRTLRGRRPPARPGRGWRPTCRRTSRAPNEMEGVLVASTRSGAPTWGRSGWSSKQALDTTGAPVRLRRRTRSTSASWLFFGAWCVGVLLLGLRAPATPAAGAARVPDRRRLPGGQRGLLAAVRPVAAAARGRWPVRAGGTC